MEYKPRPGACWLPSYQNPALLSLNLRLWPKYLLEITEITVVSGVKKSLEITVADVAWSKLLFCRNVVFEAHTLTQSRQLTLPGDPVQGDLLSSLPWPTLS